MSFGRIVRRNKQIIKKAKFTKGVERQEIRTFLDKDQLYMLSSPSLYLPQYQLKEFKDDLIQLKYLAAHKRSAYMTDVQNHHFFQFFVINKNLKQGHWIHESYNNHQDFKLYLNPTISKISDEKKTISQHCASFPFFSAPIQRSTKIEISYQDIVNLYSHQDSAKFQINDCSQNMDGFRSFICQHCMDHLKGHNFFTPSLTKGRLSFQFNQKLFEKTKFLIREYNVRIKKGLDENKTSSEQFKKTKEEYEQKIRKTFITQQQAAREWSSKFKFN